MEALQTTQLDPSIIESLILRGDISGLNSAQKVHFYKVYCDRLGLDPAAQPFKILKLQGKETLYLDRSGAQQLNKLHKVSHQITSREKADDLYIVTARASSGDRFTESIGAVNIKNLQGDNLANAMMKAETKAKRRATLDLLGLGILDETEVETIPKAEMINLTGDNVTVTTVIPQKDYSDDFAKCETLKDVKTLWESLSDSEKEYHRKIKESASVRVVKNNIAEHISKLKSNTWESWQNTIEGIIDNEPDETRKQEIINLLESRLSKVGIEYKYEPLPFGRE